MKKNNKVMDRELEKRLWNACDQLRGNISPEQYMYIIVGILFLKYMSDKYDDAVNKIKKLKMDPKELMEDREMFESLGGFSIFIPEEASWKNLENFANSKNIGQKIDESFRLIEEENENLKGLFDKDYNREELDQSKLASVVSEFSNIDIHSYGEDIIGRVYEYFLGEFMLKQGQKGGEFYTPKSIVDTLIKLVKPMEGTIYDPASGTGGMFVQTKKYFIDHGYKTDSMIVFGQEYQNKTWKLGKINLLLNNFPIENINLGPRSANSFTDDLFKGEHFDFILANPPFNQKKWGLEQLKGDERWKWGLPPENNANYAWLSHMLSHATNNIPGKGRIGTVLANGSLSGSNKKEIDFRMQLIEQNKVEAIVSLPDKLFYNTQIPACLWILSNSKERKDILFIDASNFKGKMLSKKLRELTNEEINKIAETHELFLQEKNINEIGFAKNANLEEVKNNDYSFVPRRYVGIIEEKINKQKVKKDLKILSTEFQNLLKEFEELVPEVKKSLDKILDN